MQASVVVCSVIAGLIHAVVVPEHLAVSLLFGFFFVVCAAAQVSWAALAAFRPSKRLLALGVFGNAAVVGLWLVSRTIGLPVGPEPGMREAVGVLDVASTMLEAGMVIACIAALRTIAQRTRMEQQRPPRPMLRP